MRLRFGEPSPVLPSCLCAQVDPYEARLGAMIDLNGDGEIDQDEKDYLKDLVLSGKLKSLELLRDVRETLGTVCLPAYLPLCGWLFSACSPVCLPACLHSLGWIDGGWVPLCCFLSGSEEKRSLGWLLLSGAVRHQSLSLCGRTGAGARVYQLPSPSSSFRLLSFVLRSLRQKYGEDVKRSLTWIDTKAYRQEQVSLVVRMLLFGDWGLLGAGGVRYCETVVCAASCACYDTLLNVHPPLCVIVYR